MLVVADNSALISLATCSALDVLLQLYETINVPRAVYDEINVPGKPQAPLLVEFLRERTITVDTGQFVITATGLGQGEVEAMALYKLLAADFLLIDDHRARLIAESNQIRCIGALGVLLSAKQKGVIRQITPYVQLLRQAPVYYSEALLDRLLQLAGE